MTSNNQVVMLTIYQVQIRLQLEYIAGLAAYSSISPTRPPLSTPLRNLDTVQDPIHQVGFHIISETQINHFGKQIQPRLANGNIDLQ